MSNLDDHLFMYGSWAKNGWKKKEYVTETIYGPQNLKYLLPGPLEKRFADPRKR